MHDLLTCRVYTLQVVMVPDDIGTIASEVQFIFLLTTDQAEANDQYVERLVIQFSHNVTVLLRCMRCRQPLSW